MDEATEKKVRALRAWATKALPHVKVRAKTVSFTDLARGSGVSVTIVGATHREDVFEANAKAKELGLTFAYGVVALPSRAACSCTKRGEPAAKVKGQPPAFGRKDCSCHGACDCHYKPVAA